MYPYLTATFPATSASAEAGKGLTLLSLRHKWGGVIR